MSTDQLKIEIVGKMKAEILEDAEAGVFSGTIETFSDLHSFVDANEYGGFCEDEISERLIKHFGGVIDQDKGCPQPYIDFINDCQDAIDAWIKTGAIVSNESASSRP